MWGEVLDEGNVHDTYAFPVRFVHSAAAVAIVATSHRHASPHLSRSTPIAAYVITTTQHQQECNARNLVRLAKVANRDGRYVSTI
jgi:hypothetical protein